MSSVPAFTPADRQRILTRADRIRQHVNPLSVRYQAPLAPPNWREIFPNPDQPLHVDIGCGAGRFVLQLAARDPQWNVVGVEIRQPLVERALLWQQDQGITNAHFVFTNVNITLGSLFPPNSISRLTIQFPDPWFKKRHQKRRVVQPDLVALLASRMRPGSVVFLQSDVEAVATEMMTRFREMPDFSEPQILDHNPLGIPTEREQSCLANRDPIYRYWLTRR